jgi:hypothetical protein
MNKKYVLIVALILVSMALLIPFASSNPDALEHVTGSLSSQEQTSVWQGIMADYSVSTIGNSYVSTLIAGTAGTIIVLAAGLLIGKMVTKKNP